MNSNKLYIICSLSCFLEKKNLPFDNNKKKKKLRIFFITNPIIFKTIYSVIIEK